jgi:6-phosphogluconolactonase (cycloisomerase 2 family)
MNTPISRAFFYSISFVVFGVLLIAGCAGVSSKASVQPSPTPSPVSSPTPAPSPTPTPEMVAPDHILVKGGLNGEIHREFAITSAGLQQIGNDISLPIQDRAGEPAMVSAGGTLFALDSNTASPVLDMFRFDPATGSFSLASQTTLQSGVRTFSVDPFGQFLYVNESHDDPPGSYESNLNVFRIAGDGSPGQIPGSPFVFYGGANAGAGCCVALNSSLAFTPDGTKAYAISEIDCVCHTAPSTFWALAYFLRDPVTGAISKNTITQDTPESTNFMQAITVVKNGKFLVFADTDGLMVYSIDPARGFLTQAPVPSPVPPTDLDHLYLDISATRDGEFVYLDQPNSGLLYGFHVENDGSLTPVPGSPYAVVNADLVTVSNTDNFVFVTSAPNLLAFKRDPNTGALSPFASVALNIPVHALINLN